MLPCFAQPPTTLLICRTLQFLNILLDYPINCEILDGQELSSAQRSVQEASRVAEKIVLVFYWISEVGCTFEACGSRKKEDLRARRDEELILAFTSVMKKSGTIAPL